MKFLTFRRRKLMPSVNCCTGCRTKFSILNPEAGCTSCAFAFCKKCLNYRAVIPTICAQPMDVCQNCYRKIEDAKVKNNFALVTSKPLRPSDDPETTKKWNQYNQWWGEGLPPPSMRQQYGGNQPKIVLSSMKNIQPQPQPCSSQEELDLKQLEDRRAKLKEEPPMQPLRVDEIEERLAALRGVDVELIRNPNKWFETKKTELGSAATPAQLIEMAKSRARIEEGIEDEERKDLEQMESRHRQLKDEPEDEVRVSTVSEFSTTTKEELETIDRMMKEANERVGKLQEQERLDEQQIKKLMASSRQKSLEVITMNDKISSEMGKFWEERNAEKESDGESLSEEQMKDIIRQAEAMPDEEPTCQKKTVNEQMTSPKKTGFLKRFFKK